MAYAAGNRIIADRFRAAEKLGQGKSGYSSVVSVTGSDKIQHRLSMLAKWSQQAENQIVSINRRVAKVYLNYLNANIQDFDRDILVQFKDRDDIRVRRGQLRRSLGSFQPERWNPTKILAGPITDNVGARRKKGVQMINGRKTYRQTSDGWFAHIVEGGDSFGIKKRTVNTGVFMRGKLATQYRAERLRDRLLKKEFSRYLNTLLRG
jgi:hypothetical protein